MNDKLKNIVVTCVFTAFIGFFAVWCLITLFNPSNEKLEGENRLPAQLPTNIALEQFLNNRPITDANGNITAEAPIKQFENFTVDQFPLRKVFRYIKAHFAMDILGLKENNGYAVENGSIVQITPEFNQSVVDYQIGRLEYVYNTYLKDNGGKHFVALIPDKNYYFGAGFGYPMPDYEAMENQLTSALPNMEYINLFGSLNLDSYYKTDWHWDQSKLQGVMDTLSNAMGFEVSGEYEYNEKPFNGGYTQQSALYPKGETLTYVTNDILNGCVVYNYATQGLSGLYSEEMYNTDTQYDFFLSGMAAMQRIDNKNLQNGKKLVVLRDSYGSSLVPLMAEGYETIYVVDIRYAAPMMIKQMLGDDINGADVLFIYSTTILNTNCFSQLP